MAGTRRRLGVALAASVLLHVLGLAILVRRVAPPRLNAIPIGLVGRPGGGTGAASPDAVAPAAPAPPVEPRVAERPSPPRRRASAVALHPAAPPAASAPAAVPGSAPTATGLEAGSGSGAGGGGDGGGGEGSGAAGVAYGENPLPPYPYVARRLGMEGVVLLEVLVAADGRAREVRVLRSSGFRPLDESAMTTVRERWRFLPARRDGIPVESRVPVPIRFRLEDARG